MSLVLDAGALVAVERADRAAIALIKQELLDGRVPRTHGGVVGQVWRGGTGRQANLARLCPLIVERYGTQADMAGMCAAMPALAVGGEAAEAEFLALWQVHSGAAARRALPPLA